MLVLKNHRFISSTIAIYNSQDVLKNCMKWNDCCFCFICALLDLADFRASRYELTRLCHGKTNHSGRHPRPSISHRKGNYPIVSLSASLLDPEDSVCHGFVFPLCFFFFFFFLSLDYSSTHSFPACLFILTTNKPLPQPLLFYVPLLQQKKERTFLHH